MTHDMCSTPPRSPTMVGSAVPKSIWSRDAKSIAIMMEAITAAMLVFWLPELAAVSSAAGVALWG